MKSWVIKLFHKKNTPQKQTTHQPQHKKKKKKKKKIYIFFFKKKKKRGCGGNWGEVFLKRIVPGANICFHF